MTKALCGDKLGAMTGFLANFSSSLRRFFSHQMSPKAPETGVDSEGNPLPVISDEERKIRFRRYITKKVSEGWTVEIENEFDVVLSKKKSFSWIGKLIIFLVLLLLFFPLAIFYLVVVVIQGVNAKPTRNYCRIDEFGVVHLRFTA